MVEGLFFYGLLAFPLNFQVEVGRKLSKLLLHRLQTRLSEETDVSLISGIGRSNNQKLLVINNDVFVLVGLAPS